MVCARRSEVMLGRMKVDPRAKLDSSSAPHSTGIHARAEARVPLPPAPKAGKPFKEFLLSMPPVGEDSDFERVHEAQPRTDINARAMNGAG